MKPTIIEDKFEDFKLHVIPKDTDEESIRLTRKIFFAGALVAMKAITGANKDTMQEVVEPLLAELEMFHQETKEALKIALIGTNADN